MIFPTLSLIPSPSDNCLIVRGENEDSNHFSFSVVILEMDSEWKKGGRDECCETIMMMLLYILGQPAKKGFKLEKMSKTNKKSISFKWKWGSRETIICSQEKKPFCRSIPFIKYLCEVAWKAFPRKVSNGKTGRKDKVINCQSIVPSAKLCRVW